MNGGSTSHDTSRRWDETSRNSREAPAAGRAAAAASSAASSSAAASAADAHDSRGSGEHGTQQTPPPPNRRSHDGGVEGDIRELMLPTTTMRERSVDGPPTDPRGDGQNGCSWISMAETMLRRTMEEAHGAASAREEEEARPSSSSSSGPSLDGCVDDSCVSSAKVKKAGGGSGGDDEGSTTNDSSSSADNGTTPSSDVSGTGSELDLGLPCQHACSKKCQGGDLCADDGEDVATEAARVIEGSPHQDEGKMRREECPGTLDECGKSRGNSQEQSSHCKMAVGIAQGSNACPAHAKQICSGGNCCDGYETGARNQEEDDDDDDGDLPDDENWWFLRTRQEMMNAMARWATAEGEENFYGAFMASNLVKKTACQKIPQNQQTHLPEAPVLCNARAASHTASTTRGTHSSLPCPNGTETSFLKPSDQSTSAPDSSQSLLQRRKCTQSGNASDDTLRAGNVRVPGGAVNHLVAACRSHYEGTPDTPSYSLAASGELPDAERRPEESPRCHDRGEKRHTGECGEGSRGSSSLAARPRPRKRNRGGYIRGSSHAGSESDSGGSLCHGRAMDRSGENSSAATPTMHNKRGRCPSPPTASGPPSKYYVADPSTMSPATPSERRKLAEALRSLGENGGSNYGGVKGLQLPKHGTDGKEGSQGKGECSSSSSATKRGQVQPGPAALHPRLDDALAPASVKRRKIETRVLGIGGVAAMSSRGAGGPAGVHRDTGNAHARPPPWRRGNAGVSISSSFENASARGSSIHDEGGIRFGAHPNEENTDPQNARSSAATARKPGGGDAAGVRGSGLTLPPDVALSSEHSLEEAMSFNRNARLVTLSSSPFVVVHVNAAFTRLTGIDSHDVIGRPIASILICSMSRGPLALDECVTGRTHSTDRVVDVATLERHSTVIGDTRDRDMVSCRGVIRCRMNVFPVVSCDDVIARPTSSSPRVSKEEDGPAEELHAAVGKTGGGDKGSSSPSDSDGDKKPAAKVRVALAKANEQEEGDAARTEGSSNSPPPKSRRSRRISHFLVQLHSCRTRIPPLRHRTFRDGHSKDNRKDHKRSTNRGGGGGSSYAPRFDKNLYTIG